MRGAAGLLAAALAWAPGAGAQLERITQAEAHHARGPVQALPADREARHRQGEARPDLPAVRRTNAASFGLVKKDQADLDAYVANKALDGLYFMVIEEEKKIRRDPAGSGKVILKKVFGAPR